MKNRHAVSAALLMAWMIAALWAPVAQAAEEAPAPKPLKAQTKCPIMGGPINKELFADVAGHRIYVCCAGCIAKVKDDPQKALATLKEAGEKAELRLALCTKCGELKGSPKCCAKDAAKCAKCGLNKGSIGCCKNLKPGPGEKDILLCPKCGEVKGTEQCCAKDAAKCEKCGLQKGSPGCCKLSAALCAATGGCPLKGTKSCPLTGAGAKPGCAKEGAACDQAKATAGCCPMTAKAAACPVAGACPN